MNTPESSFRLVRTTELFRDIEAAPRYTGPSLTWRQIVKLEPKLGALHREAQEVRDTGGRHFCANKVWYDDFKPRLKLLVGWCRADDVLSLKASESYATAYAKIYNALPDCRNCACF